MRRRGLCAHLRALFGVLPADRRRPADGASPADAAASFGKRALMDTIAEQIPETAAQKANALNEVLRNASPSEVIESALRIVGREHLALVSSFGTESAGLLKVMVVVVSVFL